MKIGRYIIFPSSPDNEISNLKFTKDANNNIELTWDWPPDRNIKLALVFGDEGDGILENTLTEIMEKNQNSEYSLDYKTVTKQFDKNYKEPLYAIKKKYTVYPASFGENNDIHVFDQKRNNSTPFIERHINIPYEIREISKLFGSTKTVEIIIQPVELYGYKLQDALYYTSSRGVKRYPVDISILHNNAHIIPQKNDNVCLHVYDEYKNIIRLTSIHEPR